MLRIETETDINILRQAALLLERENQRLTRKLAELLKEIGELKQEGAEGLQLRLAELERQLAVCNQKLFGDSSEKRTSPEETQEQNAIPEKKARKGHGPRQQPMLRVEEKIHSIPECDRACCVCGGSVKQWEGQFEESEEVDIVQREFKITRHKRQKYRCDCNSSIVTAPPPPKLFEGARYSINFATEVAVAKYLDHAPLERQVRAMARDGLIVDSQTLWDQLYALSQVLKPAYTRLQAYILKQPILGADETTWRLMGPAGKPEGGSKRCYAWSLVVSNAVYYRILGSRSAQAGGQVLDGYRGIVMADGYSVYSSLAEGDGGFTLVHCWAHVRRKFIEVEKSFPKETVEIVGLIGQLYAIEKQCPSGPEGDPLRGRLRAEQSQAIVSQIQKWALNVRALPQSGLASAIKYMGGLWHGLTRFLNDPRIPLDNNTTERALRVVVLGRKNHYGSRSPRGIEVAGILYSLIESAYLTGLDPRIYLRIAVHAGIHGKQVPLPHELTAEMIARATSPPSAG
jgi:transposase